MARFLAWAGVLALSFALFSACSGVDDPVSIGGGGAAPDGGSGSEAGGAAPDGGTTGSSMEDAGPPPDPSKALFTYDEIPELNITLPKPSIEGLDGDPKTYVQGDLEVHLKGEVTKLGSIGVRLKGVYGSFRPLDQKAAFLLKFNEFTKKQTLFGLKKLALNNMVQDGSMIHEQLCYDLFRAAGTPAPRTAYAKVSVNGEPYGLYATIEVVDNPLFLGTWLGGDEGALYEGAYGSDLETGLVGTFDQDNGPDVGFADLQDLVDALDAIPDAQSFVAEASKVIDLERYLDFAATEIFLGHWDGYAWTKNNYFVARRPDDGRWTFIPWGTDQTFSDYLDPFGGGGRIEQMCDASPECRMKLAKAFQGVVARAASIDLIGEAKKLKSFIWDAATSDPRKEYGMDTVEYSIDAAIDFLKNRPTDVEEKLICVDPKNVDNDGDGFSGCGEDCDDMNPAVHPGAVEECNFSDDDCNEVLDDGPQCPACPTQPAPGGGELAFCLTPRPFDEAEADCVAQGGHLASIHTKARQDLVASYALMISGDAWWIGLSDAASEDDFVWTDGTPVNYLGWNGGEPNNAGNEDCVQIAGWAGGLWNDIGCDSAMRYVCYLP